MSGVALLLKELMTKQPVLSLAVAESLTAGHLQARISAVSGASEFFLGGVTCYTADQKVNILEVGRKEADEPGSFSLEVAEQMARGVCTLFNADIGVATTGYAEPNEKDKIAVPQAYWAIARRGSSSGEFDVCHGLVTCPIGTRRVEAQAAIAEMVLVELVAFVQTIRSQA